MERLPEGEHALAFEKRICELGYSLRKQKDETLEKNLALAIKGFRTRFTLERPGLYLVRCDVHGWMQAFIRVVEEPYYAISDESGRFQIDGAPPGDYTLELWHERLGTRETTVHIGNDQISAVRIDYSPEID